MVSPNAGKSSVRDYAALLERIDAEGTRERRMQRFVDLLWDALCETGVSWVGFYLFDRSQLEGFEQGSLILGPCRDKPACSPIGLHGACGQAWLSEKPLIVHDVAELGSGYIACDPRDRSEVVVPLVDESRVCWGVLDLDSREVGAFDEADVRWLTHLLVAARLTDVSANESAPE